MEALFTVENLIAFLTLTSLEIVLGIDNIVFIVVIASRLPERSQAMARNLGLGVAMVSRLALLFGIGWVMRLTEPLFAIMGHDFSGRDLVLIIGGLFLLGKATHEIHAKLEVPGDPAERQAEKISGVASAVAQIFILDTIFSIDSVITAVGMAQRIEVMVAAVVVAVGVMLLFAGPVSRFVTKHPTIQMLAFSFLLLVGVFLMAEGLGKHIDRGYIYFAMAFSLFVELLNLKLRARAARKRAKA